MRLGEWWRYRAEDWRRLALGFQDRASLGQRRVRAVHEASRPRLSTASPPADACASILVLAHCPGAKARTVEGLTTAATVWVTAALGIACGLGRWDMAVISTVIALVLLAALRRIEALVNKPGGNAN